MTSDRRTVAILFPADDSDPASPSLAGTRFEPVADALHGHGLAVEGVRWADQHADAVRRRLLASGMVLVWVNPIDGGRDRSVLNALLAAVAAAGIPVSADPATIDRMGTKDVLYRTRSMGWGSDVRRYATAAELRDGLPRALAGGQARVLKQLRGNGADGVWKVEYASPPGAEPRLRVRHAKRGSAEEELPLDAFLARCDPYFAASGTMIDQPWQPRIAEGMVRCYLVGDRVAGFGEQLVNALCPAPPGRPAYEAPQPGPRLYYPPTRPDFQPLKDRLEGEWVGELCRIVGLDRAALPVIWDADFMYGPKTPDGADTYVLCEINVSSVYPFPDAALPRIAAETAERLARS